MSVNTLYKTSKRNEEVTVDSDIQRSEKINQKDGRQNCPSKDIESSGSYPTLKRLYTLIKIVQDRIIGGYLRV